MKTKEPMASSDLFSSKTPTKDVNQGDIQLILDKSSNNINP